MRLALILTLLPVLSGQKIEGPTFEVAAIKKTADDYILTGLIGGPGSNTPTRVRMHGDIYTLVREGFDLPSHYFVNWDKVPAGFWDFEATLPEGATKSDFRAMLRNVLIERFHFQFHRETREMPLYELHVANQSKLKPTENEPPASEKLTVTRTPDGYLDFPKGMNTPFYGNGPKFSVQRVHTTMDEFATALENEWLRNPVVNRTGLTGSYDFSLRFDARRETPAGTEDLGPPLEQALREQLGLQLRQGKGPHEMIVIDAFDKQPTAN